MPRRSLMTIEERFWSKVIPEPNTGCWLWLACIGNHGYGLFTPKHGVQLLAHRAAWEFANGRPAGDLHVLHQCDHRPCCNPDHLHLGTPADNMREASERGRTRKGASNPCAKLTEADVHAVRAGIAAGVSQSALGRRFGVSNGAIQGIADGKTWRAPREPTSIRR
jgi:hypothetical protein